MRFRTRLVATAAVASMAIAALSGPAAAHKREFMWVYAASTSDSEIKAQAELSTGKHAGTLRMTLKKKVDGEWELVASKVAKHGEDGYYTAMFSTLGDENCKVFAKHTAKDHPTIKKASNSFDC